MQVLTKNPVCFMSTYVLLLRFAVLYKLLRVRLTAALPDVLGIDCSFSHSPL